MDFFCIVIRIQTHLIIEDALNAFLLKVSLCLIITFWAGIFQVSFTVCHSFAIYPDLHLDYQCYTFVQFLIGLLRLGHLTIYLADAMVAGYTTATVLFVFASQLKSLLGKNKETASSIERTMLKATEFV